MSGTPEKILEHLLGTIKLDSNGNDAIGGSLQACFLFNWVFQHDWIHLASSLTLCCRCDVCLPAAPCVSDFLLTHKVFMPSSQLCPALQHQYPVMVSYDKQ